MIHCQVLGTLRLSASDGRNVADVVRRSKRAALVACLAVATPRGPQRRDRLLAFFWPETDAVRARGALNQALYVLRQELGEDAIVTRGDEEVGLNPSLVRVDAWDFEDALDAGDVQKAMSLYQGELLAGFFVPDAPAFEHWVEEERGRLRARAADAAWTIAEDMAAKKNAVDAARWARRSAELSPLDEGVTRRLMAFLDRVGDRSAAVAAYETYARRLKLELELEPSAELQRSVQSMRSRAPGPAAIDVAPVAAPTTAEPPVRRTPTGLRGRSAVVAIALAIIGIVASLSFAFARRNPASRDGEVRLLVLPFEHIGDSSSALYTAAISDEITTRLAMLPNLRVIGRQTALHYARTGTSIDQIGREIGVDYILAGSVTWPRGLAKDARFRIRRQLTRVSDGTNLWANIMDEDVSALANYFTLLSTIADRVTRELHTVVSDSSAGVRIPMPTRSLQAYDDYRRAREILHGTWAATNRLAAIRLLKQAVERDSTFTLALAWLSFAHTDAFWLNGHPSAHLDSAREAGARALQLDSHLADAHMAMGHYYYACCQDYERALAHLEKAHAARPGDSQIAMFVANVYKRSGRWDQATSFYTRAAELDPRWRSPLLNLGQMQVWQRHYDDAERTLQRALTLDSQEAFAYSYSAWIQLLRNGDVGAARRIIADASRQSDGFDGMRLPFYIELLSRDFARARDIVRLGQPAGEAWDEWLGTTYVRRAIVARLLGDSVTARAGFDSARVQLEARLRGTPASARGPGNVYRSSLVVALAGLGRREQASAMAADIVAANPPATDAISGPFALQNVALAYVMLGRNEDAVGILVRLVSQPARVSPSLLKLDPLWDPLRSNTRFRRLLR